MVFILLRFLWSGLIKTLYSSGKAGRLGQYQKYDEVQHDPIAIGFEVEESGLKFIVNLSDYFDTGLLPDHRLTRQMIREQSDGKKVLNLFAFTHSKAFRF